MIRLQVPGTWDIWGTLCTATPDAPSDEHARWSPACMLLPGHEGEHEAADPESGLDATIRWKGDV